LFIAFSYDLNGAGVGVAADQIIVVGDLNTPCTEPSSYTSQNGGEGAQNTDASNSLWVGNNSASTGQFLEGHVAWLGVWDTNLSVTQLQNLQFKPQITANCVKFTHYGFNGTGTQADWTGIGNDGTVTGATVSAHAPIQIQSNIFPFPTAAVAAATGKSNPMYGPLGGPLVGVIG